MKNRFSFTLLLYVAFLDYMGIGLVFTLFASLLFSSNVAILAPETSASMRGLWMGILIALTPLFQFIFSPILGSLSDQRGRKIMIMLGMAIGVVAYALGIVGIKCQSLTLLILYRALLGFSAATMTVIQAAIVDMSTPENKGKNFALYNMALGTGFTFGPFLGGLLSDPNVVSWFDFSTPFVLGGLLTIINIVLLHWKFSETRKLSEPEPIELFRGITHAKKAFTHPALKYAFLGFGLYVFGWDYYSEFVSVTLLQHFNFTTMQVGNYFAYEGLLYALCSGLLIQPIIKRFSTVKILLFSMLTEGAYLLLFCLIENPFSFLFFVPGLVFILALFFPVASTYISNNASENEQGEVLGIYHSIQALALIVSPLLSGSVIGLNPFMPIYLGSAMMLVGGGVFALHYFRHGASKVAHRVD